MNNFETYLLEIGRKLAVHKTFRRGLQHFMYVQFTFCVQGVYVWLMTMVKGSRPNLNSRPLKYSYIELRNAK